MKCHLLGEACSGHPRPDFVFHLRMTADEWCSIMGDCCLPRSPPTYPSPPAFMLIWHHIPACLEPHSLQWRGFGNLFPPCLMSVVPQELSSWCPGQRQAASPSPLWVVFLAVGSVLSAWHRLFQLIFSTILIATDVLFIYDLLFCRHFLKNLAYINLCNP